MAVSSGYMSSMKFYSLLIITCILILILCISNIVAYGNILKNDNVTFNHTWAKILIVFNAILILIALIILIILIVKIFKGKSPVSTMKPKNLPATTLPVRPSAWGGSGENVFAPALGPVGGPIGGSSTSFNSNVFEVEGSI